MAASKVRELYDREIDAFNRHDVEGFAAGLADDVKVTAPGVGELRGKEAAKTFYGSWIDAFPDCRVEIAAVHCLDDVAIEEGRFMGTHRATLHTPNGDLPPTGRSVNVPYIQVLRFRGDRIVSYNLSFDQMEMLEQLGLMEAEAEQPARMSQAQEQDGPGAHAH